MEQYHQAKDQCVVTDTDLHTELLRRKYVEQLEKPDVFPSQANWDFIIENRLTGVGEGLYRKFLVSAVLAEGERRSPNRIALKEFPRYIMAVPRDYALEVVYDDTVSAPEATRALIEDCKLFDAVSLMHLVHRGEAAMAASLLGSFQPDYSRKDLADMRSLLKLMRNLPEEGEMINNGGLLRRDARYVCPAGHVNAPDAEYCTHSGCGLNIYGLTARQMQAIEDFSLRVDALSDLLEQAERNIDFNKDSLD